MKTIALVLGFSMLLGCGGASPAGTERSSAPEGGAGGGDDAEGGDAVPDARTERGEAAATDSETPADSGTPAADSGGLCVPATCESLRFNCGTLVSDGCHPITEQSLDCGTCAPRTLCSGSAAVPATSGGVCECSNGQYACPDGSCSPTPCP